MRLFRKYFSSFYKRFDRLFPHPFRVYKRKGAYFLLHRSSSIDETILKFKSFEEEQIAEVQARIKRHKITRFYDIGANLGYYTVLIGRMEEIEAVASFEPIPALNLQIGANVLLNNMQDKWQGFKCALSDSSGTAQLHFHPKFLGTSSLDGDWRERSDQTIEVELQRFDDLIQLEGQRCFAKIDVEGNEVRTIAGMRRFLSENQVALQIEISPENTETVARELTGLGYRLEKQLGENDFYYSRF